MIWRKGWIASGWYEEKDKLHQDDMKKSMNAPGWYEEKDKLHQDDMKRSMNAPGGYEEKDEFFKSFWWKIASAARNWIGSVPQTEATTFFFSSVKKSFFYDHRRLKRKVRWNHNSNRQGCQVTFVREVEPSLYTHHSSIMSCIIQVDGQSAIANIVFT